MAIHHGLNQLYNQLMQEEQDLQTLEEELKQDLSWNAGNLDDKLQQIPILSTKWSDRLARASYDLQTLEAKLKRETRIWFNYYSGIKNDDNANVAQVLLDKKAVYEVYLPGEPDILEIKEQMAQVKRAIKVYENAVRQLNTVGFNIKHYIEWQKFKNGIN